MRDINEIRARGRLTADAEVWGGEHERTKFRMATNISYRKDGEWRERTCFHNVTVWNKKLSLSQGMTVDVRGEVRMSRGPRQKDGVEVDFYSIAANDVVVVADPAS